MDFFKSCKVGDLDSVKYWVEKKEVDVNVEDAWNATPLYYACLCGHYDTVEYLLRVGGAKCDLKTFQGERCYYAAVRSEIRKLLISQKVITEGLMRTSSFYSFCQSIFHCKEYSDGAYRTSTGETVYIHKFYLNCRGGQSFCEELDAFIDKTDLVELVLEYLYTARVVVQPKRIQDLIDLASKFKLHVLDHVLQNDAIVGNPSKKRDSKLCLSCPEGKEILQAQLCALLRQGMPEEFISSLNIPNMTFQPEISQSNDLENFDICLEAEGYRFYCHQVMLINRSEYFHVKIKDSFQEWRRKEGDLLKLGFGDVSAQALASILYYVYTEDIIPTLNMEVALEVLNCGTMYLLPGLVKICAQFLCRHISIQNVVSFVKISRLYSLHHLEDACVKFLTTNLDIVIGKPDFQDLVLDDAHEIENRETTDSIPIIDDIHGELRQLELHASPDSVEKIKEGRKLIRQLLCNLNLHVLQLDEGGT